MSACNPPDRRGAAADGETRVSRYRRGRDGRASCWSREPHLVLGEKAWDGVGKMESSVPRCGVGCVCVNRSRFLGQGRVRAGEDYSGDKEVGSS